MKYFYIFLCIFLPSATIIAQNRKPCAFFVKGKDTIYTTFDSVPSPVMGVAEMVTYFIDNYRPIEMQEIGGGSIRYEFLIDETGQVLRVGIPNKKVKNYTIDEKIAIQVLKDVGQWKPAYCAGKAVKSRIRSRIFITLKR